ncbi:MAG TPA: sugar phosphate isomerase/epimerase family protein [Chloroflexota bacterium]|nr:sugar phosphate isomerase/epimerase family protein [Chloroflexota bacterium]
MRIAYAFRRAAFYPFADEKGPGNELPPKEVRREYLRKVRALGFEAVEVGISSAAGGESDVKELRRELEGEGRAAAGIRGGGGFASPRTAANSRRRVEDAIQRASWIGANVINMTVGVPSSSPHTYRGVGHRVSHGGSRTASGYDFEITAKHLRETGRKAADLGVEISIEMHQNSIADNAWSCLHLLEMVDLPNVGVNPDLGNLYWTYEEPEEHIEQCIVALAPKAKYWHCKQLMRVHVPELERAYFIKVPLPDGDIDYRFALAAMVDAGYQGYMAIEGCREGDQLYRDGKSAAYAREVLKELGQ